MDSVNTKTLIAQSNRIYLVNKKTNEIEIHKFIEEYLIGSAYSECDMITEMYRLKTIFTSNGSLVEKALSYLNDYDLLTLVKKLKSFDTLREAITGIAVESGENGIPLHEMGLQLVCLTSYAVEELERRSIASSLNDVDKKEVSSDVINNLKLLAPSPRDIEHNLDTIGEEEEIKLSKKIEDRTIEEPVVHASRKRKDKRRSSKSKRHSKSKGLKLDLTRVHELAEEVNSLNLSNASISSRQAQTGKKSTRRSVSSENVRQDSPTFKKNYSMGTDVVKERTRSHLPRTFGKDKDRSQTDPLHRTLHLKTDSAKTNSVYLIPKSGSDLLPAHVIDTTLYSLCHEKHFNAGHLIKGFYALMKVHNPQEPVEKTIAYQILQMELPSIAKVYQVLNSEAAVNLKEVLSTLKLEAESTEDRELWEALLAYMTNFECICLATLQKDSYPIPSLSESKGRKKVTQEEVLGLIMTDLQKFIPWKMKYDLAFSEQVHNLRAHQLANMNKF